MMMKSDSISFSSTKSPTLGAANPAMTDREIQHRDVGSTDGARTPNRFAPAHLSQPSRWRLLGNPTMNLTSRMILTLGFLLALIPEGSAMNVRFDSSIFPRRTSAPPQSSKAQKAAQKATRLETIARCAHFYPNEETSNIFIPKVEKDGASFGRLSCSGLRHLYTDGTFFYFDKLSDNSKITSDRWEISSIMIEEAERQTQDNATASKRTIPLSLEVAGKSRKLWYSGVGDGSRFINHVDDVQRNPKRNKLTKIRLRPEDSDPLAQPKTRASSF